MQTRTLRTLSRIARAGSFVEAAEQLNMTLPTLSMQVKSLESELGLTLFDRSFRPPLLTPKGREIVEAARAVIAAEDSLLAAATPGEALSGNYALGFVSTASVRMLPRFLQSARSELPRASFTFESGLSETLVDRVLSGQLDAAVITVAGPVDADLIRYDLREEALLFAAHASQGSLDELLEDATFLHFMPRTGIGKLIATAMQGSRPAHAPTIVLDTLEGIMECVRQGIGFTLLPEPDIARYSSEEIVTFSPLKPGLSRKLALVVRRDGPIADGAERLSALLF